jgi:capsular exopolysaccharide synthesis family protein
MSRTFEALKQAEAEQARDGASTFEEAEPFASQLDGDAEENGGLSIDFDPSPNVEEKYQKLRGAIFGQTKSHGIKTLLVVASAHGEGATTTATSLASVLARTNRSRVLLVDANLRTPSPSSLRQLHKGSLGFTDLVAGKASLNAVIYPVSSIHSNLWIITCGATLSSPSYVFDSEAIDAVFEVLRQRYDYIIVDGAPVRDYSDSCFLSSRVDGTVIVVEFARTQLETVRGTKRQLERYGAKVVGTVLNKKINYVPSVVDRFL